MTQAGGCECIVLEGLNGRNTHGSLSLGKGKASAGVNVRRCRTAGDLPDLYQFLSATQVTAVCRPRDLDLSRRENCFCNRSGREHEGAQGYGLHGNVGDGGAEIWATVNGKRVGLHDTMTDIGICDQDTIRCYGRLRGGAQWFRQPPQDILGQWTCSACGCQPKNVAFGVGAQKSVILVPKTTSSLVPLEGLLRGLRQPIRPSGRIVAKTRSRISKPHLQQRCRLMMVTRLALFTRLHRITCGLVERILEGDSVSRRL